MYTVTALLTLMPSRCVSPFRLWLVTSSSLSPGWCCMTSSWLPVVILAYCSKRGGGGDGEYRSVMTLLGDWLWTGICMGTVWKDARFSARLSSCSSIMVYLFTRTVFLATILAFHWYASCSNFSCLFDDVELFGFALFTSFWVVHQLQLQFGVAVSFGSGRW